MKSISEIKSTAWEILTERKWFGPIIISVFSMVLNLMMGFMNLTFGTNNFIITLLIEFMLFACVSVPFDMGVKIYMLKFVRGEEVSVGNVFDGYQFALKLLPVSVITMALSYAMNIVTGLALAAPQNTLLMSAASAIAVVNLLAGIILNVAFFYIYDNDGKVFSCIKAVFVHMFKGGIWKYILLALSFVLWILGIVISFGMLAFIVIPYIQASIAVYYENIDL